MTGSNWGQSHYWYWQGFCCYWQVLGEKNQKPLLMLHGFGASSGHWRKNADVFAAAGYRVYALDLIGFGESDQPNPKKVKKLDNYFWSKQVSGFIEEVIQRSNKEKTVLIGNSLGSLVALTTLVFRPDLVSTIVAAPLPDPALMATLPTNQPNWWKKLKKIAINIFFCLLPLELILPVITRTKLIKLALQAAYFYPVRFDTDLINIVTKPAQRPNAPQALRAMCIGMALRPITQTAPYLLENLTKKAERSSILLIWGRKDNLVPIDLGNQIVQKHPWINLLVLEKTGHCPHDESPDQFNQYVLNWLSFNLTIN